MIMIAIRSERCLQNWEGCQMREGHSLEVALLGGGGGSELLDRHGKKPQDENSLKMEVHNCISQLLT